MTRMATVCKEFTRLASAVLEKAEREMSTRQKRKQERDREKITKTERQKSVITSGKPSNEELGIYIVPELKLCNRANSNDLGKSRDPVDQQDSTSTTSALTDPATATAIVGNQQALHASQTSQNNPINPSLYPSTQGDSLFDSPQSAFYQTTGSGSDIGNMHDFSQADFQYPFGGQGTNDQFNMGDFSGGMNAATAGQMFGNGAYAQQPFVPQELWNAPMTFEWDWADLGNMGNMNM